MPEQTTKQPTGSVQRALSYIIVGLIGFSVISILIQLLLPLFHVNRADLMSGGWLVLWGLPLVALPVGVLCIIALVVVNVVQRGRDNREAGK